MAEANLNGGASVSGVEVASGLFLDAVQSVLCDDGFRIGSQAAMQAIDTAAKLKEWCSEPENHGAVEAFAKAVTTELEQCFSCKSSQVRTRREHMWSTFCKKRVSPSFKTKWSSFLQTSIGSQAGPIFYQYVTDKMLKSLIRQRFRVHEKDIMPSSTQPLTYQHTNVVRYVAGYVCRHIVHGLKSSSLPFKEDLIWCMLDMLGEEESPDGSADWLINIDRGGLWHVSEATYMLFYAMEQVVQCYLRHDAARVLSQGLKEKLMSAITGDENVLFHWSMTAANDLEEEEQASVLLQRIVELWVTIRGFSYASAWVEHYKQASKKTIQRSKGLRKELYTSKSSSDTS